MSSPIMTVRLEEKNMIDSAFWPEGPLRCGALTDTWADAQSTWKLLSFPSFSSSAFLTKARYWKQQSAWWAGLGNSQVWNFISTQSHLILPHLIHLFIAIETIASLMLSVSVLHRRSSLLLPTVISCILLFSCVCLLPGSPGCACSQDSWLCCVSTGKYLTLTAVSFSRSFSVALMFGGKNLLVCTSG